MKHQHRRTLQALFRHPLAHGLRISDVEALLLSLGGQVDALSGHRLELHLPSGATTWVHAAAGVHPPLLDADGVMRLRRLLEEAGITPDSPEAAETPLRGDQALRLVMRLDHHGAQLWRLSGDSIEHWSLHPHGLWSTGQRLSHRHDRDVAGQRAPLDFHYLQRLSAAVDEADAVLMVGHGRGQSDMRQLLLDHLSQHHPQLLERVVEADGVDDTACSEAELLALAREHFGHQPHRREVRVPGQELREAGH